MSARDKAPAAKVVDGSEILLRTADIDIALMDARTLHFTIVDLLEKFEYRDRDKATIDALYTFGRCLGAAIATINDLNAEIGDLAYPTEVAQ